MKAMSTPPNTNLETLKASLEALKKKYNNNKVSENKFAAQNKEYVINLLKSIA
jgi:antirestriction protein